MRNIGKIIGLLLLILVFAQGAVSQKNMIFRFSNDAKYGMDLNKSSHPMTFGSEFAVELPMYGDWKYDYTYRFPTIGFAVTPLYTKLSDNWSSTINDGEKSALMIATYTYFMWPFVHTPRFSANLKVGAGLGTLPYKMSQRETWQEHKTWYALSKYNTSLITAGLDFNIRLGKQYGKKLYQWEVGFGGEMFGTSSFGINRTAEEKALLTFHLGAKYTPNVWALPIWQSAPKVHRVLQLDFDLTGGANQLAKEDGERVWPCGTFCAGIHVPLSNAYRIGIEGDYFFNAVYDGRQREEFTRYNYIDENRYRNKHRAGVCLANHLSFYRFTLGLDFGAYVYNPIKEEDPESVLYNFLYFKLVTKYHFSKHFYAVARMKTNYGHGFENVESGIGFTIPDFGDRLKNQNPFKRIKNPFKRKEDYTEEKIEGQRNKYYTPRVYPHK